jgi:galactonate dehydratase
MRIERISTLVVNARMRNWVFVKIETDEPGLHGWGEATLEWKTRSVVGAVEDVARFVVGEDPRRIEHLWQIMNRQYFWPPGIEGATAISGIEQALWDLKGKSLGVPVYELLGGRVRDSIRLYNHIGGGRMESMYERVRPEQLAEGALEVAEAGYTALKFLPVGVSAPLEGPGLVRSAERAVAAVREAVGPDVDLMVDLHARTTPATAISLARAFEPHGLLFLEEPCSSLDVEAIAQVTRGSPVPIATGERLVGRHQFREVFERRACHVVQPDLTHSGGLWETRKIAAMAEAYSMAVAPHNPNGPIATAAAAHLAFATPNWLIQEAIDSDVPWRGDVVDSAIAVVAGTVAPPERPGLGVEVDEAAAALHPFSPEAEQRFFQRDGTVADW